MAAAHDFARSSGVVPAALASSGVIRTQGRSPTTMCQFGPSAEVRIPPFVRNSWSKGARNDARSAGVLPAADERNLTTSTSLTYIEAPLARTFVAKLSDTTRKQLMQ